MLPFAFTGRKMKMSEPKTRAEQCALCKHDTTVNVPIGGIIYSTCEKIATAEICFWPKEKMCEKYEPKS